MTATAEMPRQVRDAEKKSEALVQQMNQPPQQPTAADPQRPQQPVPQQHAPAAPRTDPDPWEARYRTLKGKYDAEVPRLAAKINELEQRVKAPPAPSTPPAPKLSEEKRKQLGQEYIEDHQAIAAEAVAPVNAEVQRMSDELAAMRRAAFFSALDGLSPHWRAINALDSWKAWLAEIEPMLGHQRQVMIDDATSRGDAVRTAKIIEAWANTYPDEMQAVIQNSTPQRQALHEQIVPTTVSAQPAQGKEAPPITRSFIAQFYKDKAMGKYAATPDREKAIETQINEAVRAGKVQ